MTPAAAARAPDAVAAANWHALAHFARRYAAGRSLLLDVGSTTTDIVGFDEQQVLARGRNDTERLLAGELLYTGVERTPVCAVVRSVPYRDQQCPVAGEVFATMRDVYLILGKLPEAARDIHTADGRPATKINARARLGRMICADQQQFHHRDAAAMAEYVAATQLEQLCAGAARGRARRGGDGDHQRRRRIFGSSRTKNDADRKPGGVAPSTARRGSVHMCASLRAGRARARGAWDMNGQQKPYRVVKLGGSLLAWPQWPAAWQSWQRAQPPAVTLMVVGGGAAVDDIRRRQARWQLSDEQAHWLAIETMSANARQVSAELAAPLVTSCRDVLEEAGLSVLDPLKLLRHCARIASALAVHQRLDRGLGCLANTSSPRAGVAEELPGGWSDPVPVVIGRPGGSMFPRLRKGVRRALAQLRGDQPPAGDGTVRCSWLHTEPR